MEVDKRRADVPEKNVDLDKNKSIEAEEEVKVVGESLSHCRFARA